LRGLLFDDWVSITLDGKEIGNVHLKIEQAKEKQDKKAQQKVKVVCRVRPFIKEELALAANQSTCINILKNGGRTLQIGKHDFEFDQVFDTTST
jgi:hypothetical protein